jgi:lipopolysaccharide transport system permease protein
MVAPALLITAGVTVANRAGILNPGPTALPYPLFALIGTLIWHVFADAMDVAHRAFEGARSYLTRVAFPREAIIVAQLFEAGIVACVRLLLVLFVVALFGRFDLAGALWLALCFMGALLLGLGIGSLLMPFMLLFADLHQTMKLVLTYGLFLTPAIYQPQVQNGLFALVLKLNPVWPLMDAARDAAAGLALRHPPALAVALIGGIVVTFVGFAVVRATAPIVIERMLLGGR